jgi:hypothetical protein
MLLAYILTDTRVRLLCLLRGAVARSAENNGSSVANPYSLINRAGNQISAGDFVNWASGCVRVAGIWLDNVEAWNTAHSRGQAECRVSLTYGRETGNEIDLWMDKFSGSSEIFYAQPRGRASQGRDQVASPYLIWRTSSTRSSTGSLLGLETPHYLFRPSSSHQG